MKIAKLNRHGEGLQKGEGGEGYFSRREETHLSFWRQIQIKTKKDKKEIRPGNKLRALPSQL